MGERKEIVSIYKSKGLSVSKAVKLANMSRSSYYYSPKGTKSGRSPSTHTLLVNGNSVSNEEVVAIIRQLLSIDFVDYGYLKVTHWLNMYGHFISKDKVYRLMKENNLLLTSLKPSPARTFVKYTRVEPKGPFEVLEMDIKFIYVHGTGSNALVLTIIDTFTRIALSWKCEYSIKKADVKSLIEEMILTHLQPYDALKKDVHVTIRSDNGSQFIAGLVRECLRNNFIVQEFTRPATPQQNGHIESFHSLMKRLVQDKFEFESLSHLKNTLDAFYDFYNKYRIHSSICFLSPEMFFWAWENGLVSMNENEIIPRKKFTLKENPADIVKKYNFCNFVSSSEAETGSAGEQPVRNSLTEWNDQGEEINSLYIQRLFQSYMPTKNSFEKYLESNLSK